MHRLGNPGLLVCAALGCSSPPTTPAADPPVEAVTPAVTPTPPVTPPASPTPPPVAEPPPSSVDPLASGDPPTSGNFRAVLDGEQKSGPPAGMDPDIIRRLIRGKMGKIRDCYSAGLAKDPALRGRIEVEFAISATGATTVRKTTGDLKNAAVEGCIAGVVGGLTFPKPASKDEVVVTYPFVLEPG